MNKQNNELNGYQLNEVYSAVSSVPVKHMAAWNMAENQIKLKSLLEPFELAKNNSIKTLGKNEKISPTDDNWEKFQTTVSDIMSRTVKTPKFKTITHKDLDIERLTNQNTLLVLHHYGILKLTDKLEVDSGNTDNQK